MNRPKERRRHICLHCGTERTVINGTWLRRVREDAQMTLTDAARCLSLSVGYLLNIEKNRRLCPSEVETFYRSLQVSR